MMGGKHMWTLLIWFYSNEVLQSVGGLDEWYWLESELTQPELVDVDLH